jgi:hypothetical protein
MKVVDLRVIKSGDLAQQAESLARLHRMSGAGVAPSWLDSLVHPFDQLRVVAREG